MTREEKAISVLYGIRADNLNLDDAYTKDKYDALTLAIKSLEQEPFINKPCVSSGVCEHDKNKVLDKIRDEFVSLYPKNYAGEPELGGLSCVFSLDKVLEILDKYKTESENK